MSGSYIYQSKYSFESKLDFYVPVYQATNIFNNWFWDTGDNDVFRIML